VDAAGCGAGVVFGVGGAGGLRDRVSGMDGYRLGLYMGWNGLGLGDCIYSTAKVSWRSLRWGSVWDCVYDFGAPPTAAVYVHMHDIGVEMVGSRYSSFHSHTFHCVHVFDVAFVARTLRPSPPNMHNHTANPPLSTCLGSPAASNVPLPSLRRLCAVLPPGAVHVTFAPRLFIYATVSLLYAYSKLT